MGDFNKPVKADLYEALLGYIRELFADVGTLLDSRRAEASNKPEYAKRWDNDNARLQSWESSSWLTKLLGLAGGGTGASTASGARINLEVDSSTEVTTKVSNHNAVTNAHGAVSEATASKIVVRDASGKAKFSEGTATGDAIVFSQLASAATPSKVVYRDVNGRAKFVPGAATGDAYTYDQAVSDLATKQATLVSGTNIKTVAGTSLLGSGDISITNADTVDGIHASTTPVANKLLALNASAVMPCSITGSSSSCTGNAATATLAASATNAPNAVSKDSGHNNIGSFCLIKVSGYNPGSQAGLNAGAIVDGAYVRAASIRGTDGILYAPNPTLNGTTWRLLGTIYYTGDIMSVGVTLAQRIT